MPPRLKRHQQSGHLHFITFSCHNRLPYLASPETKDALQQIIEQTRQTHPFSLYDYVLMPEHVHLLLEEPPEISLADLLRIIKVRSSKQLNSEPTRFWLPRYHDFNVFTRQKRIEKTRYIHRNPVTRGLVTQPQDYPWSSFNHYATEAPSPIQLASPHA